MVRAAYDAHTAAARQRWQMSISRQMHHWRQGITTTVGILESVGFAFGSATATVVSGSAAVISGTAQGIRSAIAASAQDSPPQLLPPPPPTSPPGLLHPCQGEVGGPQLENVQLGRREGYLLSDASPVAVESLAPFVSVEDLSAPSLENPTGRVGRYGHRCC